MAGDIWEQAVETYLAMDRGLFLNPQYLIGTPGEWEASADFLAICFRDKAAWMVEVTKRATRLHDKISQFSQEYENRIRQQLVHDQVIVQNSAEWQIGLWAFVPKQDRERIDDRLKKANLHFRVTPLEETLDPSAWNRRFLG